MKKFFFKFNTFIFESGFEIEIAQTEEDLEAAFRLSHDYYFSHGRIKRQKSGIYCQLYHFLPETATVVVKYRKVVVGAVSLITDSHLSLPSDQFYPSELEEMRRRGARLIEATPFVVARHFRNRDAMISHLLMKFIYNYTTRLTGATHVIFATHPAREEFYTGLWKLQKIGLALRYSSSPESQMQGLALDLSNEQLLKLTMSFPSNDSHRNLGVFLTETDERFRYPIRGVGQLVDLVMTPELLEHFFLDRTKLYEELDMHSRKVFLEIYVQLYGSEKMKRFLNMDMNFKLRELRMPVAAQTGIRIGKQIGIGKILDISTKGCYIQAPSQLEALLKNKNEEVVLNFQLGERTFEARGHILWKNNGLHMRYPSGFGVRFTTPLANLKSEFINWVRSIEVESKPLGNRPSQGFAQGS